MRSQIFLNFPSHTPLRRLSVYPPFVARLQCILLLSKENTVTIAYGFSVQKADTGSFLLFPASAVGKSLREAVA